MDVSAADAVSRAIAIKEANKARLLSIPGIHGIGVGCRFIRGRRTNELALLLYVFKKKPMAELSADEVIPSEIEGITTDVREADLAQRCSEDTLRYRPLVGGIKIGWTKIDHPTPDSTTRTEFDGTLGCLARSRTSGKKVALTAAHVVTACADPSAAVSAHRRIGQPDDDSDYSCCSKCWATVFGTVIDASKDPDSAIIELDKCVDADPRIQGLGPLNGVLTSSELDQLGTKPVKVRGYKTGEERHGFVVDVTHDDFLPCSEGNIAAIWNYHAAIVVHPDPPNSQFGQKGDSGSPVLDANNKLVGLFFANQMINGVSTPVVARIDRILSVFQAKWDLEILTSASMAAFPAAAEALAPAGHAFTAIEPAASAIEGFQPTDEELHLLTRARDEMLATTLGQRFSQVIARHVPEVQTLIRTQKRIAAVWRRVAGADLFRALVQALRSPQSPLGSFVNGIPLSDRIAAMSRVLTRYGSPALVADLKSISTLANGATTKPYSEFLDWMKGTPTNGTD
jgi:hypothetical protein